jgi:APA family basic amino acid/polyamine antiporter
VDAVSSSVQRRLGTADATVLGLAAMLGTGVFAIWAPAAAAAGPWLLLAVVLAALVAACNAASTADLAAAHPETGGGYVYGRERLAPGAGRLAGVAFLIGKASSAAAAAGVFGAYVLPSNPLPAAVLVIVAATVLSISGVRWTARGAYALVGGMLAVLLVVVVIGLLGPDPASVSTLATPDAEAVPAPGGGLGVLTAAALVFFAFAGYARVATLGEAVRDPRRTLRRASLLALGITLLTYLLVAAALMVGLGTDRLATEATPLVTVVDAGETSALGVLVRAGAAVAAGSALLSVLVGGSRTALAMARRRELPGTLAVISSRGTPRRADVAGGLVAIGIATLAGPVAAIALSACAVLVHYAVVNLAALRLSPAERSWPRWVSALGLLLCVGFAVLLPTRQVLITAGALAVGWTLCTLLARGRSPASGEGESG